jgi:DNA-binding NarL/FixJ family response regulator
LKRSIRILVVDDFSPFRDFLSVTLRQIPEFEIVGEAADGVEAVEKIHELSPDLILLDIGLPTLSGIEVTRKVQGSSAPPKILVVSGICEWDVIECAFLSGADGYVVKSDAAEELISAVESVLLGRQCISTTGVRHVLEESRHGGPMPLLNRISREIAIRAESASAD